MIYILYIFYNMEIFFYLVVKFFNRVKLIKVKLIIRDFEIYVWIVSLNMIFLNVWCVFENYY